ncbi:MAG: MarR family transcriptional regulator [Gordonia sp. (in: high G+C Gram-positive bacteria)]|uniref:MarR family winged helix-turn-helix transcriptional regulator n=1 Tax=Gordonia sp. (in: high G+C Gram-positive bacteria) TaxID=84139 RepID=UPI0039E51F58
MAGDARAALIDEVDMAGREVSTSTVMFHTTIARLMGLSVTDQKSLDVVLRSGPLTHSQLAEATGMARPTISDVIDRLEARGYVRRQRDTDDGRRVIIAADEQQILADTGQLFEPFTERLHALYASYSDAELRTIADFLRRSAAEQIAAVGELTAEDA